ncbi:MAG: glycosyltransferase family 4 protein [Bacteroidales bacterium]|jgi:galacturonosyltransferase|nr:glycosyltransferase family 4 protein [Bacteroidales bacterium]
MKILFLSNSIGGLVNFRFELLQALVKRGDSVYLSSQIEKNTSPKVLEEIGCKFIETKMNQRGKNPFDELKLISVYVRLIKKVKPDIVVAYTIKPNIYGSIACRKLGIPIISNITGLGVALENGGLLRKISVWLYRWGMKKTDFVFFQNQESMDFFSKNNIKPKEKSLIAGSGVNLEKFKFTDYPSNNDEENFLFVGRILPQKGIKQLIDAAQYFHKKSPQVHFHIVGYKDDPHYNQLIEEMDANGIIKYHGQQTDIRPYIKMANALVHPSYYPEGISNVCLESSAMGRPVITTDKSGCKETVHDEVTGYIVRQNDSQDLIEKIEKFINLPYEHKVAMGRAAHEKVAREFNRADVVKRYLDTIDRLVK